MQIRLSPEEEARFRTIAGQAGMTPTAYVTAWIRGKLEEETRIWEGAGIVRELQTIADGLYLMAIGKEETGDAEAYWEAVRKAEEAMHTAMSLLYQWPSPP